MVEGNSWYQDILEEKTSFQVTMPWRHNHTTWNGWRRLIYIYIYIGIKGVRALGIPSTLVSLIPAEFLGFTGKWIQTKGYEWWRMEILCGWIKISPPWQEVIAHLLHCETKSYKFNAALLILKSLFWSKNILYCIKMKIK